MLLGRRSLHEELLRVPLIIKVPGVKAARVESPVELTDVVPTLCEALALLPTCANFDGQSLWATQAGQRDQGPGFRGAYSEANMSQGSLQRRSLRTEQFRFTLNLDVQTVELFDVIRDPLEQNDLSKLRPEVVDELLEELNLRPYRRLAGPFQAARAGDTAELVRALPRIRSEPVLLAAVDAIAARPSPGSEQALQALSSRPGLGAKVRGRLEGLKTGSK
jgi:arylsulfatase A-like enzyme